MDDDEAEADAGAESAIASADGSGDIERRTTAGETGRLAALKQRMQKLMASCRGWRRYWVLDEEFAVEAHESDLLLRLYPNDRRRSFEALCEEASLLHLQISAPPAVHQATRTVRRQVTEMASIVEDVATLNCFRTKQLALGCERADLLSVLTHCMASGRFNQYPASQALTTVFPRVPVWIRADCRRLEQVFVNLLVNAAQYSDTQGQIELSVEVDSGEAVVRIRDTGAGIVADLPPDTFEFSICGRPGRHHTNDGFGVELILVRGIGESHEEAARTGSKCTASGSEFTVRIPMAAARNDVEWIP